MSKVAKSVSWGAPLHESHVSDDSSNGVNIYARAAEKEVSKEKKKADKKKRAKASSTRTATDILANVETGAAKDSAPRASGSGTSRGRGRGRLRGRGSGSTGTRKPKRKS